VIKLKEDDQGGEEGDIKGRRRTTKKWMTKIRNWAVELKKKDH